MPMFKKQKGTLSIMKEHSFHKEKDLQVLCEKNLATIFGLEFVKTEFEIEGLYIDTLAYDKESRSFVILEYKKDKSATVVDQGFSYLSLMLRHKADFVLTYNKIKQKSLGPNDIDWSQSRIVFIARSFTVHQQNAVNFKDMPFELWEVVQFEGDLIQFRKLEISKHAESIKTISSKSSISNRKSESFKENIYSDLVREIKTYTEEDFIGTSGPSYDMYQSLKENISQIDSNLRPNPKAKYISYQMPDNIKNIFYINKLKKGISLHFTRSTLKDFDDPKKKLRPADDKMIENKGQKMVILDVETESDLLYAILIIQQAYRRFIKQYGN